MNPAQLAALPPEYLAEDISFRLRVVAILFLVLLTIILSLYYTARYIQGNTKGFDFWFLIPMSFLNCTALCINALLGIAIGGVGKHLASNLLEDPERVIIYGKLSKFGELTYLIAITTPKLAILCLYGRIFTTRPFRNTAYATGLLTILTFIAGVFLVFFICQPFAYNWNKKIPGGKCGDHMKAYRSLTIPNLVTDLSILVLPLPAIWKLTVQTYVKAGLFATFLVGGVGIIISTVRTVQLFNKDFVTDATYAAVLLFTWTIVEPSTYFMAACILSMKPLVRKFSGEKSITSTVLSKFRSNSGRNSTKESKLSGVVYRQRTIDIRSIKVINDEHSSMDSTSGFNLQKNGYVELGELQGTRKGETKYSEQHV